MYLWNDPTHNDPLASKTDLVIINPIPILVMIAKEDNAHHHHVDVTTEIVLGMQEREEREGMIPTTPVFVHIEQETPKKMTALVTTEDPDKDTHIQVPSALPSRSPPPLPSLSNIPCVYRCPTHIKNSRFPFSPLQTKILASTRKRKRKRKIFMSFMFD